MNRTGVCVQRRLTYAALAVSLVTAGAALWACRERLLEAWYLPRLNAEDRAVRAAAARQLGKLGSLRVVPAFLDRIRRDDDERAWTELVDGEETLVATPVLHALISVGPGARKLVETEIRTLFPHGIPVVTTAAQGPGPTGPVRAALALETVLFAWETERLPVELFLDRP